MESTYTEIIKKISRIYDVYQEKASQVSEDRRQKSGAQIDKNEKGFIDKLYRLEPNLTKLIDQMEKSKDMKSADTKQHIRTTRDCLKDLQQIIKKKSLMFKVNGHLAKLIDDTDSDIAALRTALPKVGETITLGCIGTDGKGRFNSVMAQFKVRAAQWMMLAMLQPKDSVQNFIAPQFNESDFRFIHQSLKQNWPNVPNSAPKVVEKVVEKEVIKYVNTGKATKLGLANQYLFGINREQNADFALQIYVQQADKNGNSTACAFLGQAYQEGLLIQRDFSKAIKYYEKAMSAKQPYAHYRFGLALIRGNFSQKGQNKADIEKGYKFVQQAANSDPPCGQALVTLGQFYQFGHFDDDPKQLFKGNKDLKKAIEYYMKARDLHVPRAINNLGVLYINNKNMDSRNPNQNIQNQQNEIDNFKKGVALLEQAQIKGYPQAFYNLGMIYEKGERVKADPAKALQLFYGGALKKDRKCKVRFAYQIMNQTSIMKQQYFDHYRLAIRWLQSVINKMSIKQEGGLADELDDDSMNDKAQAYYYLGLMYEHGFGVDRSPTTAYNYFVEAANLQLPVAKNKLGDCYFSGFGVKQDRKLAIGCYLDAAELLSSQAMVNLGTIYLNGVPNLVERNFEKAHEFFVKAMNQENSDALIHLSYMFRNGLGVQADQSAANQLLQQAAKNKNSTALYMLKEQGVKINQSVLYQQIENEFFVAPNRINLKEIVPMVIQN